MHLRALTRTTILSFFFLLLSFALPGQDSSDADSLLQLLKTSRPDADKLRILLALSEAELSNNPKSAADHAMKARKLAEDLSLEKEKARSLMLIGKTSYAVGSYNSAIKSYTDASLLYSKLGDTASVAEAYVMMAACYNGQGSYTEGLARAQDAYRQYSLLKDKAGMGRALLSIGVTNNKLKNFPDAIKNFERAQALLDEAKDKELVASCLNNLANTYIDMGDYDKAVDYLERSLKIKRLLGNKLSISKTLNNIGRVYSDKGEYEKAVQYYSEALDLKREVGDKKGMAIGLANLGSVAQYEKKNGKALEYYNRAIKIASEINDDETLQLIYANMAELYVAMGDKDEALRYLGMSSDLKDELFAKEKNEKVAEMQARFDVERAEQSAEEERKNAELERRRREDDNFRSTLIIACAALVLLIISVLAFFLYKQSLARKKINQDLEMQKQEIEHKNSELHAAYLQIEEKNKDITDSIRYAKRLQEAILPEAEFARVFGEKGFVLYRPKDIVSGDFYWMQRVDNDLLLAAVDCTGHGVPGAFVSIVCSNLLNQAVNEHGLLRPSDILDDVNQRLSQTLYQRADESRVRDGMDIALIRLDLRTLQLEYAGAFNPLYLVRDGKLTEVKADKFPVGSFLDEELRRFTHREMQLQKGDVVYLFSDGYADQFGGPEGKKFKRSRFKETLVNVHRENFSGQRELLLQAFEDWRGRSEQVDDILVMGIGM